ncbi:MAG: N-acetyltransferase [Hyphomonadaceae bacterium]|nr:N-acetyltransferase [Hyphomonadaceae bacterium]
MTKYAIRPSGPGDLDAIASLNDLAFGGADEGQIVRTLQDDGDSLLSLVATAGAGMVGHIELFRIQIDGEDLAAGLGPMCTHPDYQRVGIGAALVSAAQIAMAEMGRLPVFVLGHADYYPRFGFEAAAAAGFSAPWSGPFFMAWGLEEATVKAGKLTYPRAFGVEPGPDAA